VALMHHNIFFLFPRGMTFKVLYVFCSLSFVKRLGSTVLSMLEEGHFDEMEQLIKTFYFAWPIIYLIDHMSSICLVRDYQKALKRNERYKIELREANEKLTLTNATLSKTLDMLETSNKDLKAALKARELFIASASHEFRNPLNSMIGNIELAQMESVNPEVIKLLDTGKICGEVLLAMINNVLDVAKINAEKLELHYLPGNFLRLIEKVWSVSTLKMKQKDLYGELYISQSFPKYINMDSHRLLQILLNILGNSAKFTSKGFIKFIVNWIEDCDLQKYSKPHEEYTRLIPKSFEIHSEQDSEELKLQCRQGSDLMDPANSSVYGLEGPRNVNLNIESTNRNIHPKFLSQILASDCLHLTTDEYKLHKSKNMKKGCHKKQGIIKIDIIDTGCGIPSQTLPELFKPFQQGDSSIAQKFGGTGLGLYISQQLIFKMGGQINVYSQENVGSDFSILIPATSATKQETKDKECEEENENEFRQKIATAHLRALIVDHDPINRSTFSNYLKKLRVQVDEVCTGQDALNKLSEKGIQYYSFISMDLQLPGINGINTCMKIREMEKNLRFNNPIPIIIVTGNCSEQERIKCVDPLGDVQAIGFHQKPFTFKDCKLAIQMIFRKKKLNDAQGQKILVVDDDAFNTTVAEKFLKKNGFECDICYNGQEAVDKVAKGKYYAILMDCEMPEMDGYTAARLIRQKHPELLIVGVTGHHEEACLARARRSGMNVVETKPLDMKKIISLLFKQENQDEDPLF